ncbi:MAG: hypothetical protein ACLP29_17595 [Dissulfurispiraceae bacterium]
MNEKSGVDEALGHWRIRLRRRTRDLLRDRQAEVLHANRIR